MLEFYADWCATCKIMERTTFSDPAVVKALKSFIPLQADVTANDDVDKALQKHFKVIAPPAVLFFDKQGDEIKSARIVGEIDAKKFLEHLARLHR